MNFSINCTYYDMRSCPTTFQDMMVSWFCWTSLFISLIPGNILLGTIVHFERFGGDSQKRGLQNRLVSEFVIATMLAVNSFHLFFPAYELDIFSPLVLASMLKIHRGFVLAAITLTVFHSLTGIYGQTFYTLT